MKKILSVLLLAGLLFLAACGGGEESGEANASEEESEQEPVSKDVEEEPEVSDTEFENEDYKFVFGDHEQITGTRDNQVLTIEVEFTNKSDEAESPWMASTTSLEQSEVSDVTTESVIGGNGALPEDYKPDLYRMDEEINSGETVNAIMAYEIQEPGSTIEMSNRGDEKTFEKTIETNE